MSSVLFYLAVGRLVKKDGEYAEGGHVLVASATAPSCAANEKSYKTHVKQIMDKGAAKLKPEKRIRLTADDNNYDLNVMADQFGDTLLVYFAVTDTGFGKTHSVPNLLDDLKGGFIENHYAGDIEKAKENGSVHKASQKPLGELLKKYGSNKLKDVQDKVDQVKDIMKDNVAKALDNVESLDQLEGKSEQFENQAKQFEKSATSVKKMMRCQNYKYTAILVGIGVLVLTIIIIVIAVNTTPADEPVVTTLAPTSAP